jgi:hypothetical protein
VSITGQVWRNFVGFWKSQIFWTVIAAMIWFWWQYHKGLLSGPIRNNLLSLLIPYIGIVGGFLFLNTGHAIFRAEWKAFKKRQHEEYRAQRKAEIEHSKPPVPKPNLQFRRIFDSREWFGHEISGHAADVMLVEIGNELADRVVGRAGNVRAHVTYLDSAEKQLQIRCPGYWTTERNEIDIPTGESKNLLVAVLNGAAWMTDPYQGIQLQSRVNVQVRLLDRAGQPLADTLFFELRFGNSRYPACKWIPVGGAAT